MNALYHACIEGICQCLDTLRVAIIVIPVLLLTVLHSVLNCEFLNKRLGLGLNRGQMSGRGGLSCTFVVSAEALTRDQR